MMLIKMKVIKIIIKNYNNHENNDNKIITMKIIIIQIIITMKIMIIK